MVPCFCLFFFECSAVRFQDVFLYYSVRLCCVSRLVVYVVRVSVCRCSFSLLGAILVVVFLCFMFRFEDRPRALQAHGSQLLIV